MEKEYKAALIERNRNQNVAILQELRLFYCIADIVFIDKACSVFEIKTDRDTLKRLQNQLDEYHKFSPSVSVLTGNKHLKSLLVKTAIETGVYLMDGGITEIRKPKISFNKVDTAFMLDVVRTKEAIQIASILGFQVPKVGNTLLRKELKKILSKVTPEDFHKAMAAVLINRAK